ncbi:MAG: D-glycero-beta-D-manno-heptose 1,7-bisphosphate 7-phosphatase [Pseudomonadota bacterium]
MKLVILDRDGVINADSDAFIKSADEWEPIPGSLEAIALLNQSGYHIAVATNQSGIARGLLSVETLHEIHQKMTYSLAQLGGRIDAVFFCPHGPDEGCPCRKPSPGMLLQISDRLGVDLRGVPFVGDSISDTQAATQAGASPVMVRTGKGARTLKDHDSLPDGLRVFDDLAAFVDDTLS